MRKCSSSQSLSSQEKNMTIPGSSSLSNMRRNVSFANVTVREYEQTLGDQPCSSGPPVSLGWDFNESFNADVEDYEASREGTRRQGNEMKMPAGVRVARLLEHGHTRHQINKTAAESRRAMNGRINTANESEAKHLALKGLQSLGRKVRRAAHKGRGKSSDGLFRQQCESTSSDVTQLRKSCPEIRRVQSMGEFLTAPRSKSITNAPIHGILKTSKAQSSVKEDVSEGFTEESDSDISPNLVRRSVSLDETALLGVEGEPKHGGTAETPERPAVDQSEEGGICF